jgi:hypothetical protein
VTSLMSLTLSRLFDCWVQLSNCVSQYTAYQTSLPRDPDAIRLPLQIARACGSKRAVTASVRRLEHVATMPVRRWERWHDALLQQRRHCGFLFIIMLLQSRASMSPDSPVATW